MKIIFEKNEFYSNGAFFYQALNDNKIDGMFLNVIRTKDEILIVVNQSVYANYDIKNLTYEELKELDEKVNLSIITLEESLNIIKNTKKKIILNIIPQYLFDFTEQNYEQIINYAILYINQFYTLIKKYPNLNIYISSRVEKTIYLILKIIKDYKIGIIVSDQNLTFVDVDFYVIGIDIYNKQIITELLGLNREVMLRVLSRNDIDEAKSIFKNKNNLEVKNIFDKVEFITYYPNVLYQELS